MKDNKVERVRQSMATLRRQFLQSDAGVFNGVLAARARLYVGCARAAGPAQENPQCANLE
jgi:hypothetical protein